jgi:hypothetical protein
MAKKTKKRKEKVEIVTVENEELDECSSVVHYRGTVEVEVVYKDVEYIMTVRITAEGSSYDGGAEQLNSVKVEEIDEIVVKGDIADMDPEDCLADEVENNVDWESLEKEIRDYLL